MMEKEAPGLISFAQKAAHVCNRCRIRKQKCDRVLPRCNRCVSSDRHCDYSQHRPMPQANEESEPLVVRDESCSQADLSCRGASALLQRLSSCADPFAHSSPATIRLWDLLREILDLADFDINDALHAYGTGVHPWCPILDESMLPSGSDNLAMNPAKYPMFSLCMWFLSARPCPHSKDMVASELYRTMKQVFAVINCDGKVIVEKLQFGMMIAVFEITHGLRSQASMTVSNCAVMLQSLDLVRPQDRLDRCKHMLQWLRPSLLRLECIIHLSSTSQRSPLVIPPNHSIHTMLHNGLGSVIPPAVPHPNAISPRKLFFRTAVSLVSGRVSAYIHAQNQGLIPDDTYEQVNESVNEVIGMLQGGPASDTWLHCASFAMLVCSHILLQRTEYHSHAARTSSTTELAYITARLHASRVMAWNMLRVAIEVIETETAVPHVPFAALCAVLRGGIAVLETRTLDSEDIVHASDVNELSRIARWFAGRWHIGKEYVFRIQELSL